jgi:ferredoxin
MQPGWFEKRFEIFKIILIQKIMAIKKVWIEEGCSACGLCEEICPEVFKLEDVAIVIEGVNLSDYEDKIKEAAESCPMEVIKYSE